MYYVMRASALGYYYIRIAYTAYCARADTTDTSTTDDTRVTGDQSFKPFNARRFVSAKLPQQRTQPTRLVHGENGECVLSLSLSPGKYEVTPRSQFTLSLIRN